MPEQPKSFQDVMGGGEFYPDLPHVEFSEMVGETVLVLDASLIEDLPSKFGAHDAILLLVERTGADGTKAQYTTISSGQVIIKRVLRAKREDLLPLLGTILKEKTYYNIL